MRPVPVVLLLRPRGTNREILLVAVDGVLWGCAIATELHDNPAFEVVDVPTCGVCGTEMRGSICPR